MTVPYRVCLRCQLNGARATSSRHYRQSISTGLRGGQLISTRHNSTDDGPGESKATIQIPNDLLSGGSSGKANRPSSQSKSTTKSEEPTLNTLASAESEGTNSKFTVHRKPRAFTTSPAPTNPPQPPSGVATTLPPHPPRSFTRYLKHSVETRAVPWATPVESYNLHTLSQLNEDTYNRNTEIRLRGWITSIRILGDFLVFASLLQQGKTLQITFSQACPNPAVGKLMRSLKTHTPIEVKGFLGLKNTGLKAKEKDGKTTLLREGAENPVTGWEFNRKYELLITDLRVLGDSPSPPLVDRAVYPAEKRYLTLRTDFKLLKALQLRNKVARICRDHLENEEFMEIETPILFKSTAEGAREFLVPTRTPGHAYALPQSPQQYKQILMAGGIMKYYQIARCFRDEDLRADRQPEFTQLDLEMGFAFINDVSRVIERLLKRIWWETQQIWLDDFPVMSYHDAIRLYGSDKPDLRFDMKFTKINDVIDRVLSEAGVTPESNLSVPDNHHYEVFCVPNMEISNAMFSKIYGEMVKPDSKVLPDMTGNYPTLFLSYRKTTGFRDKFVEHLEISCPRLKGRRNLTQKVVHELEKEGIVGVDNCIMGLAKRAPAFNPGGSTPLGDLRKLVHAELVSQKILPKPTGYRFVWVTHFPLFEPVKSDTSSSGADPGQSGASGYKSTHHPFTAPIPKDALRLFTHPWTTTAQHHDIVCNGVELGGGSTRIWEPEVQKTVLKDILKVPDDKMAEFGHLIDMLRSGCPPHAGMALGFDRLVAMLTGEGSIKSVIAFPKNSSGVDAVVGSPGVVGEERLEEYGLRVMNEGEIEYRRLKMVEKKVEDERYSDSAEAEAAGAGDGRKRL